MLLTNGKVHFGLIHTYLFSLISSLADINRYKFTLCSFGFCLLFAYCRAALGGKEELMASRNGHKQKVL